jgi:tetratricopeptide (TPR) repeat protein
MKGAQTMGFWDKLFGKGKTQETAATPAKPAQPEKSTESLDERINRLWESARELGWSDADREKAVTMYTELLGLVDEGSTSYNVCAILRNRALSHRSLKNYDAALEDLAQELEIAQRKGDQLRVMECQKITKETHEWKRNAEIEAGGGPKAEKIRKMEEAEHKLWRTEAEAEAAFETLFSDLQDGDPDVRAAAARLLADNPNAIRKLISVYQDCLGSDPRKGVLAGRVLGRKMDAGSQQMIHAQISAIRFGIQVAFTPCVCDHCGQLNVGIPVPERGLYTPFYSQQDDQNCAYALPVLCDFCGKEFFIAWDSDPR